MHTRLGPDYPIHPEHIDDSHGFMGHPMFQARVAKAAEIVIGFIKERGSGWEPFTDEEIQEYFRRHSTKETRFEFRRVLFNKGFLNIEDDQITVTHGLVSSLFMMWPHLVVEAPQERSTST